MNKGKTYGIGVLLTIIGGVGLASEHMISGLMFGIWTVMFSIGFGMVLWSYRHEQS